MTNEELFTQLREVDDSFEGTDTNERVNNLIATCIELGITKGSSIVGVIKHLGFKASHVGVLLAVGTGTSPERHSWYKSPDGQYSGLVGSTLFPE